MRIDRSKLATERLNPRTRKIDSLSALGVVGLLQAEDRLVAPAVARERRRIARAVELIAEALAGGGRLLYAGAGTSGRLGVLDASECPPTFGVPRTLVQGIIAGGRRALVRSIEGAEDDEAAGRRAVAARRVGPRDAVVGIAASGLTPFVRAAVEEARRRGARTVFFTCSPQVRRLVEANVLICPVVGPEAIAGSTRMKAGTATKMVLNQLTTGAFILLGKVYGNLMVDLRATNAKLRDRAARIVGTVTGLSRGAAEKLLARAEGRVKTALLMHLLGLDFAQARRLLARCGGRLREAIEIRRRHASASSAEACPDRAREHASPRRPAFADASSGKLVEAWRQGDAVSPRARRPRHGVR